MKKIAIFSLIFLLALFVLTSAVFASPTAVINTNPSPPVGPAPLTVQFDGTGSTGTGLTYLWDFKDGATSTSATVSHQFTTIETYNVSLTVKDNTNATDTAYKLVDAQANPSVTLTDITSSILKGQTKDVTATITNNGNVALTNIAISLTTLTMGSETLSTSLNPLTISSLAIGESKTITVTVSAATNQAVGDYYGNLSATFNSQTVKSQVKITVQQPSGASFSIPSEIDIGSDSQTREETITTTFTIINDGSDTLNNIIISSSGVNSKYQLQFTPTLISSLTVGNSATVTLTAYVPDDQDSGKIKIGNIIVSANSGSITKSTNLYLETENNLEINKAYIDVNGKRTKVTDGDSVDAKPGDDVSVEVTLKNTNNDYKMKNVVVTVKSDDLDVDESTDLSDISHDGGTKTGTVTFTIPSDADEDSYTLEITGEADDTNGAHYITDTWNVDLNVQKKSHELSVISATFNPTTVSCTRNAVLDVEVQNIGSNDEDKVVLRVENSDLNYYERPMNLDINSGDSLTKTFNIKIPKDAVAGDYVFDITTFYNTNTESDSSIATLTVTDCSTTQPTQTGGEETTTPEETGTLNITTTTGLPTSYGQFVTQKTGIFDLNSIWFIILMGLLALLLLVVIIILIVRYIF